MAIAAELHKTEEEIADWPLKRIAEWQAFFRLRNEAIQEGSKGRQVASDKPGVTVEHF